MVARIVERDRLVAGAYDLTASAGVYGAVRVGDERLAALEELIGWQGDTSGPQLESAGVDIACEVFLAEELDDVLGLVVARNGSTKCQKGKGEGYKG